MSLSVIQSRAGVGTDAPEVTVEVHLSRGLPSCAIVGLPETAVKESRDRVRGAILNAGFEFPRQRITVNLAPADLPKEGGRFDLPIALGILAASGQVKTSCLARYVFLGELALSGALRPVRGALVAALSLRGGDQVLVLPAENASQAQLVQGITVAAVGSLQQIAAVLNELEEMVYPPADAVQQAVFKRDFSDIIGQPFAKRALEIAAAGHHSLLMSGPPGTGKTMLASRLVTIMPPMSEDEALESAAILSLGQGGFDTSNWKQRPFRAPHHSASGAALIGGGSIPAPGEISLAHHGVLFLDELPEFNRRVLELLREPLESGVVCISRAARQCRFLARFLLVAAANPCPCGYLGNNARCVCTPEQVARYRTRLSGPLLDRVDMHLSVQGVPRSLLRQHSSNVESSATVRHRVTLARQRQLDRQGKPNGFLESHEIGKLCRLREAQADLLDSVAERFGLSARANHRILKMARTVADLSGRSRIGDDDLLMAVKLRCRNNGSSAD